MFFKNISPHVLGSIRLSAWFNIFSFWCITVSEVSEEILRSFQDGNSRRFEFASHKTLKYRHSALKHNVYHNYHPIFGTWSASYRSIFFRKKWTCQPTNFRSTAVTKPYHPTIPSSHHRLHVAALYISMPPFLSNPKTTGAATTLVRGKGWCAIGNGLVDLEVHILRPGVHPCFRVQRWRLL